MGNFNSRSDYMLLEGFLFGGICLFSCLCWIASIIAIFLVRNFCGNTKDKLAAAGKKILRAGEFLENASSVTLQNIFVIVENMDAYGESGQSLLRESDENNNERTIANILERDGRNLQNIGNALVNFHDEIYDWTQFATEEFQLDSEMLKSLKDYLKVVEWLKSARKCLERAYSDLEESAATYPYVQDIRTNIISLNNKIVEAFVEAESGKQTTSEYASVADSVPANSESAPPESAESDVIPTGKKSEVPVKNVTPRNMRNLNFLTPYWLLAFYRLVFRYSIEEVTVFSPNSKVQRVYLFGGYRFPRKPFWLHVYYLSMVLIAFNWFLIMFIDTLVYRKATTCNDLNVKRSAYLCFDVSETIDDEPIDCTDEAVKNNDDIYVICYLQYLNFPIALSLAYSFTQLVLILIHVSFTLTLWCVKNLKSYVAIIVHCVLLGLYILFFITYGPVMAEDVNGAEKASYNLFYGERIMRPIAVFWAFVSLLLITFLSPYHWLIDKYHRQYRPSYYHNLQKKDI